MMRIACSCSVARTGVGLLLALNLAAVACSEEPTRPIHQVLDEKPAELMLNYFLREANELGRRQPMPTNLAAWEQRREALRSRLRRTLGTFPWDDRPPVRATITGRIDHGDHVVEKVLYESLPGLYVTALAYVPKNTGRRMPAVICVNGHWPDAKATELIQRRCMALARIGVLAFCQDVIGTGERQAYNGSAPQNYHGFYRGATPRIVDRSLQGYVMFECVSALDYVASRDDVDPARIMCTGASGGGMQSMYFAALDDRLAGAVPVCYISSYETHMGATACVCEVPAGILRYTNQWEILALHAPRPLFCIAAARDVPVFLPAPMLATLEKTRAVYKLYGAEDRVTSAIIDSGHDYNEPMRALLYRHVAHHLVGGPDEAVPEPADLPVEPVAALAVGLPANSETMRSLTFQRAGELVSRIEPPRDAAAWPRLKQQQLERLQHEILGGISVAQGSQPKLHRTMPHNGHTVEHWTFEPEPGIVVPAVLCIPQSAVAEQRPAVLLVDEDGKQANFASGLVDALLDRGFVVLAVDYRGVGETAETVPSIAYGPGTPEYNLTNYSLFVGRPIAGARITDIRAATDFLANRTEVDPAQLAIVGRGRGALSAVLAAAFDERLRHVVAEDYLTTLVFDEEFVDVGLEYMIPNILTVADTPHLLAQVAPRPLLVLNPVDGRRRAVTVDQCRKQLQPTVTVYDVLGASDRLQPTRTPMGDTAGAVAEWLAAQETGERETSTP